MQTNGTLHDGLPDWVLGRLSNILVSIDGGEKITDGYRGRGIYRPVLNTVNAIRERVGGTLTPRVTWSTAHTSFEELDELAIVVEAIDYPTGSSCRRDVCRRFGDRRKLVLVRLIDKFFASTRRSTRWCR